MLHHPSSMNDDYNAYKYINEILFNEVHNVKLVRVTSDELLWKPRSYDLFIHPTFSVFDIQ